MNKEIKNINKFHNDNKNILLLSLYIFINIIIYLGIINLDMLNWISNFTVISLVHLLINIIFLKLINYRLFSLPILFIVFTYLFHFGQLLLILFNVDIYKSYDVINMVSYETFIKACTFTLYSQTFLMIGVFLVDFRKKKEKIVSNSNDLVEKYLIYKVGIILFLIGIIPKLYIDINKIILYIQGNYLSTYQTGVSGALSTISKASDIGIIMLLIGKQDNKRISNLILIGSILYQIIIMFTGNRGRQVVFILALIFIYFNLIKKVRIKTIILWSLIGYIGIVFINFVSDIRMAEVSSIIMLNDMLKQAIVNSPLFEMLSEFGGTMITLCYSIMFFTPVSNYSFGSNYLYSLLTFFPNINGVLDSYTNQFIFTYNIPINYRTSLGGSYLGELYFAFGNNGMFVAIIIGVFIGMLSRKLTRAMENNDWIKLSINMILFPGVLWWVRGYFTDIVREFLWLSILIILIYRFIKKSNKKDMSRWIKDAN